MALFNLELYEDAIQQFLNALSLNPNADHIWDYIKNTAFHWKNKELMGLAEQRNLDLFRAYYFEILDP